MNRYHGRIGYIKTEEVKPGIFDEVPVERYHSGDILRNSRRWEIGQGTNDNIVVNNQLSIVADGFANENFQMIRYAEFNGVFWTVTNVEIQSPRLILTLGGEYNGKQATTA